MLSSLLTFGTPPFFFLKKIFSQADVAYFLYLFRRFFSGGLFSIHFLKINISITKLIRIEALFIFLKWYIQRYCWVFKRDLSSKSFEMEGFFSGWERRKKSLFTHESRIIYGPGRRNVVRNRKKNCLPFSVYMANASIKSWYTVVLMHHHFDGFCDFKQMLGIRAKKRKMNQLLCALLSDTIQRGMRTNALISIEFASVVFWFFFLHWTSWIFFCPPYIPVCLLFIVIRQ